MPDPSAKGQIMSEGNCGASNYQRNYLKISAIVSKMGQIKKGALLYQIIYDH